jgi:XTP/dITP diphosphohydrolase
MKARLATGNRHKLDELRAALPGWELDLVDVDVEETGTTYEENARLKAEAARAAAPADAWALGEDSGIEADALGGGPGVLSARWAEPGRRALTLVERVAGEPNRRARMVSTIVAVSPDGHEVVATGVLQGEVAREKRGTAGFGYDPVFIPDGQTQTVAELGDDWKREHSHRARAAQALLQQAQPSTNLKGV